MWSLHGPNLAFRKGHERSRGYVRQEGSWRSRTEDPFGAWERQPSVVRVGVSEHRCCLCAGSATHVNPLSPTTSFYTLYLFFLNSFPPFVPYCDPPVFHSVDRQNLELDGNAPRSLKIEAQGMLRH